MKRVQKLASEKLPANATSISHEVLDTPDAVDGPVFVRLVPKQARRRKTAEKST